MVLLIGKQAIELEQLRRQNESLHGAVTERERTIEALQQAAETKGGDAK